MLIYDTEERCIVCGYALTVFTYSKKRIVLWCHNCQSTITFCNEQSGDLFAPPQLALEVTNADGAGLEEPVG